MSDFRNQEFTFQNAGVYWNSPAEDLKDIQWRQLQNIDITREGVLECRPHRDFLCGTSYFTPIVQTVTTGSYVHYPSCYTGLGECVYFGYVGQTADDEPGFLSIHRRDTNSWPQHTANFAAGGHFQCFLNGLPILECRWHLASDGTRTNYYPPLMLSSQIPTVVRIQSANGPLVVIIDGRWKLIPSLLTVGTGDYANWGTDGHTLACPIGTDTVTTPAPETVKTVDNYTSLYYADVSFVGLQPDPYNTSRTTGPTIALGTGTGLTGTYNYLVTYKNKKTGARSIASTTSTGLQVTNTGIALTAYYGLDPLSDIVEIWRKGGNIGDSWRLATSTTDAGLGDAALFTYPSAYSGDTFTLNDTVTDAAIALKEKLDNLLVEPFPTTDSAGNSITLLNYQDKTTYPSVVFTGTIPVRAFGPFLGQYAFWIGDPEKPAAFFWNKKGKVDLSSPDLGYNTVNDPGEELQNGFIYGGQAFIFSRRKLYALDYGGPSAAPEFVPREVPIGTGLAAPNGLAQNLFGVFFVGTRGVYITDGSGGTRNISEAIAPIFRGESVNLHSPELEAATYQYPALDWDYVEDIRLCATDKNVHLFYRSTYGLTEQGSSEGDVWTYVVPTYHLVFDLIGERWLGYSDNSSYVTQMENESTYVAVYNKIGSPFLYFEDDDTRESGDAESTISCIARTASWNAGIPLTEKCFATLMLDYDPDGATVQITPYYNSDTVAGTPLTNTVTTAGRRIETFDLGDYYARSISLELKWSDTTTYHPKFYRMLLLFHPDEEKITHWHVPASALGNGDYFHIKDSYWCLKSTAAVTLTVNIDGTDYTYTLASTAGVKTKVYQELKPLKGKLFSFTLDSTAAFAFYGEESTLNGKLWKTSSGYQQMNPFGAAGYAQYLRTQGGT